MLVQVQACLNVFILLFDRRSPHQPDSNQASKYANDH